MTGIWSKVTGRAARDVFDSARRASGVTAAANFPAHEEGPPRRTALPLPVEVDQWARILSSSVPAMLPARSRTEVSAVVCSVTVKARVIALPVWAPVTVTL